MRFMFAATRKLSERLLDAADVLLDFATLGEYGLEPIAAGEPEPIVPCGGRRRPTPLSRLPELSAAER